MLLRCNTVCSLEVKREALDDDGDDDDAGFAFVVIVTLSSVKQRSFVVLSRSAEY